MHSLPLLSVVGTTSGQAAGDPTRLLWTLLVLFAAAKVGAELAERLGQPAVVAEILAGVLVGPEVLRLAHPSAGAAALSELGAVFLLFHVGLQTRPHDILRVGKDAFLVACGGVALPFVLGCLFARHYGYLLSPSLFVGAALVATSVGITARVLSRLGVVSDTASRVILAAAVIDDILGLLVLAVVSSFTRDHGVDYRQIALTVAYAGTFVGVMLLGGVQAVGKARPLLERLRIGHSMQLGAIGLCLLLSAAAGSLGVAAIVGAFLAGMAFSEAGEETGLNHWFEGLAEFLVPFFLAGIGMQLKLASLGNPKVLSMCLILSALAAVGKVVGCALPVWRRGRLSALRVGVGMIPRGEVGMIVAQFGLACGALDADLFAVVLFVAVASTVVAPPLLTRLFAGSPAPSPAPAGIAPEPAG